MSQKCFIFSPYFLFLFHPVIYSMLRLMGPSRLVTTAVHHMTTSRKEALNYTAFTCSLLWMKSYYISLILMVIFAVSCN